MLSMKYLEHFFSACCFRVRNLIGLGDMKSSNVVSIMHVHWYIFNNSLDFLRFATRTSFHNCSIQEKRYDV
jgi:hypothetical protein